MPITEARLRELIRSDEGQYHDRKSLLEGPPGAKRPRDRRQVRDQIAQQVALFFQDMPEYPTFAWQEALVNAVAHRDYSVQGQAVEVWLFEDRLEVLSPGVPPPEVSIDELRLGRPAHASRNPRIARVLAELGVMRDQGEGIPRMFEEMEVSFLPVPELNVVGGRFRVVLKKEPIFKADDATVQAVRALPISVTQKRALVALIDREFANADYCELNGIDRDTAYRELQELVERGFVTTTGAGAAARYRVQPSAIVLGAAPPQMAPIDLLVLKMRDVGYITSTDYREAFGVDRKKATDELGRWVAAGVLVREGERRGTRYRPGNQWPPV